MGRFSELFFVVLLLVGTITVFAFLTQPLAPPTPITNMSVLKADPDEYHGRVVKVRTDNLPIVRAGVLGYFAFHDRPPLIIVVFPRGVEVYPPFAIGTFHVGNPHTITVN